MPTVDPAHIPTDPFEFEAHVAATAVYFTAFVRVGPFDRRRIEAPTQEAALEQGAALAKETGKNAMIYAVNAPGRSAYLGAVAPDGAFTPTAKAKEAK